MPSRLSPARRWLLRGLVLLLVPVVVLATPNVATAATKVSGTTRVEFGYDKTMWGQWASCSFQAFYSVSGAPDLANQAVKWNSAGCETGPGEDISGGLLSLDFQGTTPAGAGCSASTSVTIGADDDPPPGSVSFGLVPTTAENLCTVAQVCWSVVKDSGMPFADRNSTDESGCAAADMGVPELPAPGSTGTDCAAFNIPAARIANRQSSGNYAVDAWFDNMVWKTGTVAGGNADQLGVRLIIRRPDGSVGAWWSHVSGDFAANTAVRYLDQPALTVGPANWINQGDPGPGGGAAQQGTLATYQARVIGVQVYPNGIQNTVNVNTRPQDSTPGYLGVTDPSRCIAYFGEKIAVGTPPGAGATATANPGTLGPAGGGDDPDPAEDPTGPVTPADDDEGCGEGFSIFNPLSWASAGFCEVVSALSSLLKTLGGIPGMILDGLRTMLRSLFVPSDGYLDDAVGDVRDDFEATTPGAYVAAFGDLTPGSVSGCGGLSLDVPLPGVQVDTLHIGAACSGFMANVAALVRLGLSAVIVVGGGLACVRALGSGFGWRPGVGRGEAA